jgi:hypothetical protein
MPTIRRNCSTKPSESLDAVKHNRLSRFEGIHLIRTSCAVARLRRAGSFRLPTLFPWIDFAISKMEGERFRTHVRIQCAIKRRFSKYLTQDQTADRYRKTDRSRVALRMIISSPIVVTAPLKFRRLLSLLIMCDLITDCRCVDPRLCFVAT